MCLWCGGQPAYARQLALKHGVSSETGDRYLRLVHEEERKGEPLGTGAESARELARSEDELERLKPGGNREAIRDKANEVEKLRARHSENVAARAEVLTKVNQLGDRY